MAAPQTVLVVEPFDVRRTRIAEALEPIYHVVVAATFYDALARVDELPVTAVVVGAGAHDYAPLLRDRGLRVVVVADGQDARVVVGACVASNRVDRPDQRNGIASDAWGG